MLSFALLVLFVVCGLVYARASKTLNSLDKLRLQLEPPAQPQAMLHAATQFARKMGIPLAPGNEELRAFCVRHGHGDDYSRANRLLLGSILVALACAVLIVRLGPVTSKAPVTPVSSGDRAKP